MSSKLQWQSKQINENPLTRAAVLPTSLVWYQTIFTGIWFGCFESDDEVQDHPVTMLTRFDPGGFFPLHGHPGGEEILVLKGNFVDETGVHPPGTYMLNPEGFIHRPYSEEGCLTFVKLRQHGGKTRQQIRINIHQQPAWQSGVAPGIEYQMVYQQPGYLETVWFERWQPYTRLSYVVETQVKEIFIVEGIWQDEFGSYPSGSWLRYPPNCPYSPQTETGCIVYVKTYPTENIRFVVGAEFQHPPETLPYT